MIFCSNRGLFIASEGLPDVNRMRFATPEGLPDMNRVRFATPEGSPDMNRVRFAAPEGLPDVNRVRFATPEGLPDMNRVRFAPFEGCGGAHKRLFGSAPRKVSIIGGTGNIPEGKIGFGRRIFCFAAGLSGKNKSAGAGNGAAADSV